MEKIRIVFDSFHLYHLPQFEPVIEKLQSNPRFTVRLSYSSLIPPAEKAILNQILPRFSLPVITAETEIDRGKQIRSWKPQVFICGWSRYDLPDFVTEKTLVGMIYHGIGVKPSYWRDHHPRLDVRFVEGPLRIRQLTQNGIKSKLTLTGFAKLDPLFIPNEHHGQDIAEELKLDPDKPTLLYAPTFYPSSLERFGLRLGPLTEGYNVILKLHMWTYFRNQWAGVSLKSQLKLAQKLETRFAHIHLLGPEAYNIVPYYQIADLLLTEASSTIYEMMALDKPVVLADFYKLRLSHQIFRQRLYKKRLNAEMSQSMTEFCLHLDKPRQL
ncbi:MAG: CDP-glycerol glycerophosphotransferase family protein, partial [Fidelibacterota bacterium]